MDNQRTRSTGSADSRADDGNFKKPCPATGSESDDETRFEAGRAGLRERNGNTGGREMTTATMDVMELVAPEMAIEGICHLANEYETYVMQGQPSHLAHVIDDIGDFVGDVHLQPEWYKIGDTPKMYKFRLAIPSGDQDVFRLFITGKLYNRRVWAGSIKIMFLNHDEETPVAIGYFQKRAVEKFVDAYFKNWGIG